MLGAPFPAPPRFACARAPLVDRSGWFSNLGLAAARRQPGYPGWVLASRPATPGREAGLGRETGSVRTKNGLGRCGPAVDDRDLRPTAPFVQEGPMKIDNSPARGMRDLLPA